MKTINKAIYILKTDKIIIWSIKNNKINTLNIYKSNGFLLFIYLWI